MTREDLEKFKSTVLGWITSAGGGSGPFAPTPHDLNSAHHTGNISDAQHGARTVANAHQHSQIGGVTADQHHAQAHVLATNTALGPDHTISGAAAGQVLKASGPAAANFAQLAHSELSGVGANPHATIDTHIAATAAHGATGAVVGTTNAQTLTNKTLTTPTIGDLTNANHNHTGPTSGGTVAHSATTGRTANDHHNQQHTLATNAGLGADHTISGAALGWVLRATSAVAAAWAQLQHSDLGGVTADQHHAQAHAIGGADHTGVLLEAQLPATAIREADAASATPETVGSTGATVGTGYLFARSNHKHIVDLAMNAIWTGLHTFQGLLKTHHVEPEAGELYDIGSVTKRYRTLRVAELAATLFSKEQVMVLGNQLIIAKDADILPSAMTNVQTSYNFGRAMTPNDWIQITAEDAGGSPATEWVKVGTLVSGTTYNITRNVDGSGANAWAEGTPYIVIGQSGDYRLVFTAGNPPSMKIVKQGAAWNTTSEQYVVDDDGPTVLVDDYSYSAKAAYKFKNAAGDIIAQLRALLNSEVELRAYLAGSGASVYASAQADATHQALVASKALSGSDQAAITVTADSNASKKTTVALQANQATVEDTESIIKLPVFNSDPLGSLLSIPGMRMMWHGNGFIGNAAAASLMDRLGADHHLTPNNGPADAQFQNSPFPPINYTDFNGTNHWYHRASEAAFNDSNYLDIWAVVRVDTLALGAVRIIYDNGATTHSWRIYLTNSGGSLRAIFEVVNGAGVSTYATYIGVTTGTWMVIRAQFIASTLMAITVNGSKNTATPPASMRAPAGNFQLGRMAGGSNYFDGQFYVGGIAINAAGDATYNAVFQSIRDYLGV